MIQSDFERMAAVVIGGPTISPTGIAAAGRFAPNELEHSPFADDWLITPPPKEPGIYVWEGTACCHTFAADCEPVFQGSWRRARPMEAWALVQGKPLWSQLATA